MADYIDGIFSTQRQGMIDEQAAAEQKRKQAIERRERQELADRAESLRLGRAVVGLLNEHGVPSMPIIEEFPTPGPGGTPWNRLGDGWPVLRYNTQRIDDIRRTYCGITTTGLVFRFNQFTGRILEEGAQPQKAIVASSHELKQAGRLSDLQYDPFKTGILSLINRGQPFEDK